MDIRCLFGFHNPKPYVINGTIKLRDEVGLFGWLCVEQQVKCTRCGKIGWMNF